MRTGKLALAVLMTAGVSAAADPSVEVHIYVRGGQHVDLLVTRGAQHRASEMLRSAGVRVVWKSGRLSSADCCKPQLVMQYGADPSRPPDVLAYAFPYGNGDGESRSCTSALWPNAGVRRRYSRTSSFMRSPTCSRESRVTRTPES